MPERAPLYALLILLALAGGGLTAASLPSVQTALSEPTAAEALAGLREGDILQGRMFLYLPRSMFFPDELIPSSDSAVPFGVPVRLSIPAIAVDAFVEQRGLAEDGTMAVPTRLDTVAWYELGARPGELGSAVFAGHYGLQSGVAAVFDGLNTLDVGDIVVIEDDVGRTARFLVRELRRFNPKEDAAAVFDSADGKSHVNLVTCDGVWDPRTRSYSERLVVFTDMVTQ